MSSFQVLYRAAHPGARVRVRVVAAGERWTSSEREVIEREWARALERARIEDRCLFDGELLGLSSWRSAHDELELNVSPVHYREFRATQLHPPPSLCALPPERRANPVGTSAVVVTADELCWFGRRSEQVEFHRGHVHCFGGILEPRDRDSAGRVDAHASILRELQEELGVTPSDFVECSLLGMVEDTALRQPELVFVARTNRSGEELQEAWQRAESADEHGALCAFASNAVATSASVFAAEDRVAPVARAACSLLAEQWGSER